MPIGINPLTFALGHQWSDVTPQHTQIGEYLNLRSNLAKVLSYFPFISIIVGILRLVGLFEKEAYKSLYPVLALRNKVEEDGVMVRITFRAIGEILSFTFLLLILDLIADFIRMRHGNSRI